MCDLAHRRCGVLFGGDVRRLCVESVLYHIVYIYVDSASERRISMDNEGKLATSGLEVYLEAESTLFTESIGWRSVFHRF